MISKDYGNKDAKTVLIQAVDGNSVKILDEEVRLIQELTGADFCLKAVVVDDWFQDLSPWKNPAVFGNNSFGDGAAQTLEYILDLCAESKRDSGKDSGKAADGAFPITYIIGGYSLSGLFALWAAFRTDVFAGVAAASPSMWFPGFIDYMKSHNIGCSPVYLSLGDRESKTKNKVMSTVDDCIRAAQEMLSLQGVECTLEWNKGNHFSDVEMRCARAFAWVLNNIKED